MLLWVVVLELTAFNVSFSNSVVVEVTTVKISDWFGIKNSLKSSWAPLGNVKQFDKPKSKIEILKKVF